MWAFTFPFNTLKTPPIPMAAGNPMRPLRKVWGKEGWSPVRFLALILNTLPGFPSVTCRLQMPPCSMDLYSSAIADLSSATRADTDLLTPLSRLAATVSSPRWPWITSEQKAPAPSTAPEARPTAWHTLTMSCLTTVLYWGSWLNGSPPTSTRVPLPPRPSAGSPQSLRLGQSTISTEDSP